MGLRAQEISTRPVANAVARVGSVTIDGRFNETAWSAVTPITSFTQQKPTEGATASEQTSVRILYDDDAIYIAARMSDSRGRAGITSMLTRRGRSRGRPEEEAPAGLIPGRG